MKRNDLLPRSHFQPDQQHIIYLFQAGASAAATAFAELWTPLDTAGPVAWLLHGVGTLISGAVGYWIGSSPTRTVYEITVENERSVEHKSTGSGFGGFGGGSSGGGGSGGSW